MSEPHKDRRAGLIAFGVLQILLGCFSFLLLLRIAAIAANAAQNLFLDSAATVYFIATGIGSIRGRRWARALIAAVSSAWTVFGVLALAVLLFVQASPTAQAIIAVAVFTIALPLVLALFYSSRDTALTADELDPKVRWTDRAPVPVLALCAVLAFCSIETLMTSGRQTFVLFGHLLAGAPATLAMIALAILFAHLAIQAYRLRESAWWVLMLLHVIGGATSAMELRLRSPALWATIAVGWIAFFCFLIWLRRYFVGRVGQAPAPVLST
jgi:hypothetical protein